MVPPGAWGNDATATCRAFFEEILTDDNIPLIRSFHRSLRHSPIVYIQKQPEFNKRIWIISLADGGRCPIDTHAGGSEIHILPDHENPVAMGYPTLQDPISRRINPRMVLTFEDRLSIQRTFSDCVGVRLLVCGFIVILFQSKKDMRRAWDKGIPPTVGALRVIFNVPMYQPSVKTASYGYATGSVPNSCNHACLGLRLRMESGEDVITTVTHAYVKLRPMSTWKAAYKFTDFYIRMKEALLRTRPLKQLPIVAVGWTSGPMLNTSIGKTVWLAESDTEV